MGTNLLHKFIFAFFAFFTTQVVCFAQLNWNTFVEDYIFNNEENGSQTELIYEQLNELRLHPIDLNTATVEQLLQIPTITEEQAQDIINYRNKNYPFESTGELMYVKSLNREDWEIIQLFCFAGEVQRYKPVTLKNIFKFSKHEVFLRSDFPLYLTEGQRNGNYRGNRMRNKLRYAFRSMSHVYASIQTEKDEGERGYDYIAGYVMLKDINTGKNSEIRELIVGNYRANFGLGLAVNTGISYGKNMQANVLSSIDKGFSPHSSFVESNYLSGGAFRYRYKKFTASVFGAFNKLDGNFNSDSTGITSIKTDGLHRTALEYSKRHNLKETNIGGNLYWELNKFQFSFTSMYTHYSIPLAPVYNTRASLYRRYNPSGKELLNYSVAYSYKFGKFKFIGETAFSNTSTGQGGFATLNGLQFRPNIRNNVQLLVRSYGAKYTAIQGHAFSENAKPQNEQGIYVSWTSSLTPSLDIYTYLDFMRFPWLKNDVSTTSSFGIDYMAQATWAPGEKHQFLLRYHIKSKQKDYTKEDKSVSQDFNTRQTVKLQHTVQIHPKLTLVTTANGICITFAKNSPEVGFSIAENVRWTVIKNLLRLNFSLSYVDTDTYNARVYNYEPSLLYSFGIKSYYYQAIRTILVANVTPLNGLTLSARYSMTKYLDHDTTGSGNQQIKSSFRSDVQLLLRYTF